MSRAFIWGVDSIEMFIKKRRMVMKIGIMIKKQRMAMGLTQEGLAEHLNVTPQAVSRWENALSYPDTPLLPRISQVLHISCDTLLLGEGDAVNVMVGEDSVDKESLEGQTKNAEIQLLQNDIDMLFQDRTNKPSVPISRMCQEALECPLFFTDTLEKTASCRVLVADDSDFLRMMVNQILSAKQYTVLEAKDGGECMDVLMKEHVDMLILDIHMPVLDGFEVLTKVREHYPNLPVVMLTAACDEKSVQKTRELGASSYVIKPFSADVLLEHIRNV